MTIDLSLPWVVNYTFEKFNLQLTSYQFFLFISLLIAYFLLRYLIVKFNTMSKIDFDLFYGITIAFIFTFAAIFTIVINFIIYSPVTVLNNLNKYVGISSFGGMLGIFFSLILFTKSKYKVTSFPRIIDSVIIVGFLAMGIGRLGCFTSGCCYGVPTNNFPYVIYHKHFYAPINLKLVPVQLYESLFLITISIIGLFLYLKLYKRIGIQILFIYLVFRFIIEFYRFEPAHVKKYLFFMNIYQLFILIAILLFLFKEVIYVLSKLWKRKNI
ncbi:MAG: diacylglyceryl transferase [Leptospiraceae bacterium]|nr:MAG: diacylglyceryl transferase [Leptospiraceae bacterium]